MLERRVASFRARVNPADSAQASRPRGRIPGAPFLFFRAQVQDLEAKAIPPQVEAQNL